MQKSRAGFASRMALVVVLVGLGVAGQVRPAHAQEYTQVERDAIRLVEDWNAAWATGNAETIAALMAEDCVFRHGLNGRELGKGRTEFVNTFRPIFARGQGTTKQSAKTYVIGTDNGVEVLQWRIDTGQGGRTIPVAAFLRVKNGKVQDWIDMTLVPPQPAP